MLRHIIAKGRRQEETFRAQVLRILSELYPKQNFRLPDATPSVILAGETQVGLQNLKAKFEQSDRKKKTLHALVEEHFAFVLATGRLSKMTFGEASSRLRPQIMPPEYAEQAPIITFLFGKSLAVGIVLDEKQGYSYLKREDAKRWQKTPKFLLNTAVGNLNEASRPLPMQRVETDEVKFIGIERKDGFDAARILIPGLRSFIGERIGSPFRFGVPNRDFLICWNTDASEQFVSSTSKKLRKDFEGQPYPLSPNIFETDLEGIIIEHENKA
jgi:uncharacterized protein YtpQ (UPF0354 family)